MKKIFLFFVALLFFVNNFAFAGDLTPQELNSQEKKKITFIYIHGSNDFSGKKRLEFRKHFDEQVKNMHPYMLKAFNQDELTRTQFLKNGEYEINPEPVIFYWGDKSFQEVVNLDDNLSVASIFSPKLPQIVRGTFAHCLHDAVWVQKYQNMAQIIDELHVLVKNEIDQGNKVVLLGYSAGSFITYEYFLNKFISLNPEEIVPEEKLAELNITKSQLRPTCLDALMEAGVVSLNIGGKYAPNPVKEQLLANLSLLNDKTASACFADNTIKGVINFASPLALFYSEISDSKSDLNFLSKLMYKHIIETDTFWLTVNYAEDPLGFPSSKNISREELNKLSGFNISPSGGFVYDKSDARAFRSFITAHLAYWTTQKRFTKAVIEAYNKGFANMYGEPSEL